jgi:hypothetical protein
LENNVKQRKQSRGPARRPVSSQFEESIDRFATAAATVSTQIASHAQRMDAIDAMTNRVQLDIRDLRADQTKDTRFIHERIDTIQRDLTGRLDTQTKELTEHFDTGIKSVIETRSKDGDRIKSLEKWNWTVIGGGAVVTVLFLDVLVRFFGGPLIDYFMQMILHTK